MRLAGYVPRELGHPSHRAPAKLPQRAQGKEVTYYPDLSPYRYTVADQPMLNVGWLEPGAYFPRGPVPAQLVDALLKLGTRPRNKLRGFHFCEFCSRYRGTGEIHVVGASGIRYAAPMLIIHYIFAHRYRPPKEFVEAVLSPVCAVA
ncbi:hypothetical protein LWC34_26180 [Kibdelosporangium philippinense]|uniref:DUF7919 domain-containing protein n=1 Tax=Kibdelosporangium philippinense TaxID=211113 RepID=A0ABS8ZES6_9PSEU|nr:hypothetical protein [Kibdelosporangium philippinense]MCE7006301.1 hypothetical protein [Kibdelosporangium philippinense]